VILTKTTCRVCGAYPVFIDNETGESWEDQDAAEIHVHGASTYHPFPDQYDLDRADDDGFGMHVHTGGSMDDSTGYNTGSGFGATSFGLGHNTDAD
jgi:hypothetical protein